MRWTTTWCPPAHAQHAPECEPINPEEGQVWDCVPDCPALQKARPDPGDARRERVTMPNKEQEKREVFRHMFDAPGASTFIIFRDIGTGHEEVLMERCPKKQMIFGHEWFIPGGKLNDDENSEQAMVREAFEELGIEVRRWTSLPIIDGSPPGHPYYPLYCFVIQAYGGTIPARELDSGVELQWIPVSEAMRLSNPQASMMIGGAISIYSRKV